MDINTHVIHQEGLKLNTTQTCSQWSELAPSIDRNKLYYCDSQHVYAALVWV